MSDQARIETAIDTTIDNCEVLRARLAKYEDAEGRPLRALDNPALHQMQDALEWLDDYIARCNGDDRGSCLAVNYLRDAFDQLMREKAEAAALKSQPSGVVLPPHVNTGAAIQEILQAIGIDGDVSYSLARQIWNACLYEVARINPSRRTPAESILRRILGGDAGRQMLDKLATGQATETKDGKAWLEAREWLSAAPSAGSQEQGE